MYAGVKHDNVTADHRQDVEDAGDCSSKTESIKEYKKTNWRKLFILLGVCALAAGAIVAIVVPVCISNDCTATAATPSTTTQKNIPTTTFTTTSTTRRTPWTTLTTTPSTSTNKGPITTIPPPLTTTTTRAPITLPTLSTSPTATTTIPTGSTSTTQEPVEREVTVMTKYGPVTGHRLDVIGNGNVAESVVSYLGVPYAKPPVGPLRWKRPEEPDVWSEPYIADKLPNMCYQELFMRAIHVGLNFSEDCLYMNIYTPADASKDPYPVFLWIHGGGFQIGGGVHYPGHFPALKGIVIVSINYRLGVFGFLSTDDPASDSNYGVWDHLQALKFVRENIRSFGGDPDKITIGGESSGGVAVGLMLISPLTEGLFHQGVQHSGTEMMSWAVIDLDVDQDIYIYHVAAELGCNKTTNAQMLDCLRDIDTQTIFNTRPNCSGCRNEYIPVVDGPGGYIPAMPRVMRDAGAGHPVRVLAGTNKNEKGTSVMALDSSYLTRGMNRSEFEDALYRLAEGYGPSMTEENAVENLYQALLLTYSPWPFIDDGDENKKAYGDIMTDTTFVLPTNNMLHYQTKLAPCYQYMFGVQPYLRVISPLPKWMGVLHFFEIPYLFGWPQIQVAPNDVQIDVGYPDYNILRFADMDRQWSNYLIHLWMNFVKFGDPNVEPLAPPTMEHHVTWSKQTYEERWYLSMENEEVSTKLNFRQIETSFMNNYVKYIGLGIDLHHDLIESNGTLSLRAKEFLADITNQYLDNYAIREIFPIPVVGKPTFR